MNNPTALTIYNRPAHLLRILNALRPHEPEPLYIFSDGAKDDPADRERVTETRKLALQVDWTHPFFVPHPQNMGLARSMVYAIDFVLERHDTAIILEDDCLPGLYFYEFMAQCLERYADNDRVMCVNGWTMPLPPQVLHGYPHDLYFNPRIGCWGWATWRRAWALYERDLGAALARAGQAGVDLNQGGRDAPGMFRARMKGKLDAWTGGWILATYINKGYCIYPTVSHTQNIGMDGSGVHCGKTGKWGTPLAQTRPTRYPDDVVLHRPILDHFMSYYGGYSRG